MRRLKEQCGWDFESIYFDALNAKERKDHYQKKYRNDTTESGGIWVPGELLTCLIDMLVDSTILVPDFERRDTRPFGQSTGQKKPTENDEQKRVFSNMGFFRWLGS
jgi:hypothetical protein